MGCMVRRTDKRRTWHDRLERARIRLARPDALLQLALLGILTGLAAGLVIVAFRYLVEGLQEAFLPGSNAENYEGLGWQWRLLLPVLGGVLLAALFRWWGKGIQVLGVARVMERMAYHQGYLTLREFVLQFVGAAVAIASGHSVGREGPHVHLGAASGSLLGQWLTLPNNSIRTLAGCGIAAGISASFNTPLAGVVFALEVVMLEYSVASFVPVILSAAIAALVSHAAFGGGSVFEVPAMSLAALSDVVLVVMLGLMAGAVAAGFNFLLQQTAATGRRLAIWWRLMLAGVLGGVIGVMVPEVMGIGYDSLHLVLAGEVALATLGLLVAAKLVATTIAVGLGVPGGMIGPSLFIGTCLGGIAGSLGEILGASSGTGFFALLGMGAMMGASLQAPLAALTAMMELTSSPGIIMPGMLVVVIASLTASELFGKESLFVTMLRSGGMDYEASPVLQALRRVGVASVMSTRFARVDTQVSAERARAALAEEPMWLLVGDGEAPAFLLRAVDLASHLDMEPESEEIDLGEIPGRRYNVAAVNLQATLQEGLDILRDRSAEALYVERMTAPGIHRVYGILTREMVDSAYRY
jgi:H+/Cl- antiporter ClcA